MGFSVRFNTSTGDHKSHFEIDLKTFLCVAARAIGSYITLRKLFILSREKKVLANRVKHKTNLSSAFRGAWGLGASRLEILSLQVAFYFGAGLSGVPRSAAFFRLPSAPTSWLLLVVLRSPCLLCPRSFGGWRC